MISNSFFLYQLTLILQGVFLEKTIFHSFFDLCPENQISTHNVALSNITEATHFIPLIGYPQESLSLFECAIRCSAVEQCIVIGYTQTATSGGLCMLLSCLPHCPYLGFYFNDFSFSSKLKNPEPALQTSKGR